MTMTDVDPNAGNPSDERFTNHIFDLSLRDSCGPPGQAIHVPPNDANKSKWPPSSLFEAIYASTVISHFGVAPEDLFKKWEVMFYPNGASKAGQTDDQCQHGQDNVQKEKLKGERKQRHDGRQHGYQGHRDGPDGFDMVMMLPFIAMAPEDVRDYFQQCRKIAAAKERK
jgi:hypothetical protein